MRTQPEHAFPYGAIRATQSGIREGVHAQSIGSAGDQAHFARVACKNRLLWLKAGPLTLSLLGLALAVVLWGLEYKVSLYHPHPNHSIRVGVAKLWVGPRKAVFAKSSCTKSSAPPASELHLLDTRHVRTVDCHSSTRCWNTQPVAGFRCRSRQQNPRPPPSV